MPGAVGRTARRGPAGGRGCWGARACVGGTRNGVFWHPLSSGSPSSVIMTRPTLWCPCGVLASWLGTAWPTVGSAANAAHVPPPPALVSVPRTSVALHGVGNAGVSFPRSCRVRPASSFTSTQHRLLLQRCHLQGHANSPSNEPRQPMRDRHAEIHMSQNTVSVTQLTVTHARHPWDNRRAPQVVPPALPHAPAGRNASSRSRRLSVAAVVPPHAQTC